MGREMCCVFACLLVVCVVVFGCRNLDDSSHQKRAEANQGFDEDDPIFDDVRRKFDDQKNKSSNNPDSSQRSKLLNGISVDLPQNDQETGEYATDVRVIAGCEENPYEVAIARQHAEPSICEHIVMTAARDVDGDFYEVWVPFVWGIGNPLFVDLECLNGPNDDFCWPIAKSDLFDLGTLNEPMTAIMACGINSCPDPRPADCADLVCASVGVASVVNLEGVWSLSGQNFDPGTSLNVIQDGRRIFDDALDLEHGEILGANVHFDIDDYAYDGVIDSDRVHMNGTVTDTIGDVVIGEWFAERVGP